MRSEAIIRKIVDIVNEGHVIKFERDLGGDSLTIYIDELHTHVGIPEDNDFSFEALTEGLYDALTNGPGLSWS